MFLLGDDYRTVWQLAHDWGGQNTLINHSLLPSQEVQQAIHRILVAIRNRIISVRTQSRLILSGDDFLDVMFDMKHDFKFIACLKKNRFDKDYLDSLYVWRPEVIRWCKNDMHPIPDYWKPNFETNSLTNAELPSESEAENKKWHENLTDRQKRIVGALHIANRLWEENKQLSYDEVWNHEDMKKYDKPRSFPSLDSFKEWARDIAPQEAKVGGRRKKTAS